VPPLREPFFTFFFHPFFYALRLKGREKKTKKVKRTAVAEPIIVITAPLRYMTLIHIYNATITITVSRTS